MVAVLLADVLHPRRGPQSGKRVCDIGNIVCDAAVDREHVERRLLDTLKRQRERLAWDVLRMVVPEDDEDSVRFLWGERFERMREKRGYVEMVYDPQLQREMQDTTPPAA